MITTNLLRGSCLALGFGFAGTLCSKSFAQPAMIDFQADVHPILSQHCYSCHGPEKQKGGLRLDSREMSFVGGDSGDPSIVSGDSESSLLIELVEFEEMPPKGELLSSEQLSLLKAWIDQGAEWPDASNVVITEEEENREMIVTQEDKKYWAFLPLSEKSVSPQNMNTVDALLGDDDQWPEADRRTLIRRLYFNLIGLPPEPHEVTQFASDDSPRGYENLVDKLLADERFGERWARRWLDLARFADSDGYEGDEDRPHAWPYRDWVIRALNSDLPYDTFVQWQLAGDEIQPNNPQALAATGFLAAGPRPRTIVSDTRENQLKARYDELDDIVSTTSSAFMGLTLGCARCHDHKYDPIPTRDYYRFLSAFSTTERRVVPLVKEKRDFQLWKDKRRVEWREAKMEALQLDERQKVYLREPLNRSVIEQRELYELYGESLIIEDDALFDWLDNSRRKQWIALETKATAAEDSSLAAEALVVMDRQAEPEIEFLLSRGDVMSREERIELGFLQALTKDKSPEEYLQEAKRSGLAKSKSNSPYLTESTYQRKALAQWMTDLENGAGPLLARVMTNRFWQYHFGQGFTDTPNDVGFQSEEPRQPELLEALAKFFVESGWSVKTIHKEIVMSARYRAADRSPLRLEAEVLRDSILAASGRLNPKMYGEPFRPIIPAEAISTRSKDAYPLDLADGPERWRRSIYAFNKRSVRNPLMEVFDSPDPNSSCGRRSQTTVPTQALALMNNKSIRDNAQAFAERVRKEAGELPTDQISYAFQVVLGRSPTESEFQMSIQFLVTKGNSTNSLTDFCHALYTLNEFIYVD